MSDRLILRKDRVSMTFDLLERRPTTDRVRALPFDPMVAFRYDDAELRLHSYRDFSYIESRVLASLIGLEVEINVESTDVAGVKTSFTCTGLGKNMETDLVDGRPTSVFVIESGIRDV